MMPKGNLHTILDLTGFQCQNKCLILIIFIGISFRNGGKRANASSDKQVIYTSVLVEEGDTLSSLADRYYSSYSGTKENFILSICNINNIDSDSIEAGEYIIIPLTENN